MPIPYSLHRRVPLVRRPFYQRDVAIAERDSARNERDAARRERDDLRRRLDAAEALLAKGGDRMDPAPSYRAMLAQADVPKRSSVAAAPQRYVVNHHVYVERGGRCRAEDLEGFLRDNPQQALDLGRFYFFCLALDLIDKDHIPGDFVELGVAKGNTASVLAKGAQRLQRQVYLLDTYEGFSRQDLVGVDAVHDVHYADASLDYVQRHVTGAHVHFVRGYFPDTATQLPDDARYAFVHLDCDLYKPFSAALAYFWPRLSERGFLVMHDYHSLYWDGVEQAVDEFFAERGECIVPIPDMSGTVVVRKSKRLS
jgi:O-methyltransferase